MMVTWSVTWFFWGSKRLSWLIHAKQIKLDGNISQLVSSCDVHGLNEPVQSSPDMQTSTTTVGLGRPRKGKPIKYEFFWNNFKKPHSDWIIQKVVHSKILNTKNIK